MADSSVFSLEDEDYNHMFITQECKNNENSVMEVEESDGELDKFLGVSATDFSSPCVSIVKGVKPVYSDISDDDDYEGNFSENADKL